MAQSWAQVTQNPAYQALPPDQQEAARQQYFQQVVAPQLPDDNARSMAKAQFDKQTGPMAVRPDDIVVRPTADQLEPPGFLEGAGRQLSMSAHSLAQTVPSLVDAVTAIPRAAINYGEEKLGVSPEYRLPSLGEAASAGLTAAGIPDYQPETAGERYVQAANRGVGGVVGGGLTSAALRTVASPVAASISNTLSARPVAQLASAVSGSEAAQGAKDLGVGQTGQIVAGLAGGFLPSAVGGAAKLANTTLVQPFTQEGRQQLVANYANNIAGGPINITPSAVPGVNPTLAEASANPGLAQLQRALANQPENAADFGNLASANNAARQAYLTKTFGNAGDVEAATAGRDVATRPMYQQATSQAVQPTSALKDLAQRPAIAQAIDLAKDVMANRGTPNADPLSSVGGLQLVKLQLDRMRNADPNSAIGRFGKAAVGDASDAFMKEVNDISPDFQKANATYAQLSRPVTAMKIGQAIADRGSGNIVDPNTGVPSLQPNAFSGAMNNADRIAKQVSGQTNASLAGNLEPQQVQALNNVRGDLDRVAFAQNAGRASGSNTGQNILSQNALDNFASAVGMPGIANTAAGKALFTSLDKVYSFFGVPAALKADLTRVSLNPQSAEAQQVWAKIPQAQRQQLYSNIQPYLTAVQQMQQRNQGN